MAGAHGLHWLALAAIRRAPKRPMFFIRDCIEGIPKLRSYSTVGAILQQPAELTVLDFVSDFRAELKIQSQVIDTPRAIGFHENTVVCIGDEIIEFPIAGFERYIGHPNQRNSIPSLGAHAAIALHAQLRRRFP